MKQYFIFLISTIMLISIFSGCSQNKISDILIFGFSDSVPEIKLQLEYPKWSKDAYQDLNQAKTISIEYEGITTEGKYFQTDIASGAYELHHTYYDANNQSFKLDEKGNLITYFFKNTDVSSQKKPKEECEKIAYNTISKLSNVSLENYRMTTEYNDSGKFYEINFKKYINNISTEDRATIIVYETGKIMAFHLNMFGKIPSENIPNIDLPKIESDIIKKLDSLTVEARKKYDAVKYQSFKYSISMSSPDEYILLCYVDVKCINSDGIYDHVQSELISFVVPLSK